MQRYKFQLKENKPGKIYTPGVTHGYSVGNELDLIHRAGKYIVIRIPGSADWSSRGESEYYPSQWLLAEIEEESSGFHGKDDYFSILERREPGRKWKKAKTELIEKANKLAAKQQTSEVDIYAS